MGKGVVMLSCSHEEGSWYYYHPDKFGLFQQDKRKRCCSCHKLININDQCVEFIRCRETRSDVEEKIHGDEVPLASYFMCEKCGEIYFNLSNIGYCICLGDNMNELLSEYWKLINFKPINNDTTAN